MISLVLDTHTVIWLLHADPRLSPTARKRINQSALRKEQIAISSISLVEITYLEEKARIPANTLTGLLALLSQPDALLVEVPLTSAIVTALRTISRTAIPEMPDRIIAGTALHLGVPLITRDSKIQKSFVPTIW